MKTIKIPNPECFNHLYNSIKNNVARTNYSETTKSECIDFLESCHQKLISPSISYPLALVVPYNLILIISQAIEDCFITDPTLRQLGDINEADDLNRIFDELQGHYSQQYKDYLKYNRKTIF